MCIRDRRDTPPGPPGNAGKATLNDRASELPRSPGSPRSWNSPESSESSESSEPPEFPESWHSRADPGALVGLVSCSGYETSHVRERLRAVLAPLGGMSSFVEPGERIALKPNLLMAAAPDRAITTHPAVIEAVAEEVREAGAEPFLLESPGAGTPYSERFLRRVYQATGVSEISSRTGLELSYNTRAEAVSHPEGRLIKRMELLSPALEADGLISIPKLKTHNLMAFTGAVKNLFGLIPGYSKPGYHAKLADKERFADMLLDINTRLPARLSVMDAITALEGEGPGSGGDAVEGCSVKGFRLPERMMRGPGLDPERLGTRLVGQFVKGALNSRPRPKVGRCTACEVCVASCPSGAVSVVKQRSGAGLAQVDDERCILCYCCHELCPEAAIDLEYKGIGRIIHGLRGLLG